MSYYQTKYNYDLMFDIYIINKKFNSINIMLYMVS